MGSVPVNNRAGPEEKRIRKEFILEKYKQHLGNRKFWAPKEFGPLPLPILS